MRGEVVLDGIAAAPVLVEAVLAVLALAEAGGGDERAALLERRAGEEAVRFFVADHVHHRRCMRASVGGTQPK